MKTRKILMTIGLMVAIALSFNLAFGADISSALDFIAYPGVIGASMLAILPTDDEDTKKAKQALIEAKDAAVNEAKSLFEAAIKPDSAEFKAAVENIASKSLEGLKIKHGDKELLIKEAFKSMQDQFDELAAKFNEGGYGKKAVTLEEQLKKQFEANAEQLKAIHANKSGVVTFDLKAVEPISTGNFGDRVIIGMREPGIDKEPKPRRFIFDYISSMNGGAGSNPLSWVERVPKEGGAEWTAELAEKPDMDWTYRENKVTAETLAVWTAVSRQALLNFPILMQEINTELREEILNELDYAILTGDGTGNTPLGIDNYALAFNPGSITVTNPNELDVLRAAIAQVQRGATPADRKKGGFQPNAIFVSIDDAAIFDMLKSDDGGYVLPPFASNDNTIVKGVPVIPSQFIEAGTFYVGDFTKYLWNFVEGIRVDIGYINDQFITNQLTVRAELYGAGRVKFHQQPALVKGTFEDAIEALEGGS